MVCFKVQSESGGKEDEEGRKKLRKARERERRKQNKITLHLTPCFFSSASKHLRANSAIFPLCESVRKAATAAFSSFPLFSALTAAGVTEKEARTLATARAEAARAVSCETCLFSAKGASAAETTAEIAERGEGRREGS